MPQYFWPSPIRKFHRNNGRLSSLDLMQLLSYTPLRPPPNSSRSRSKYERAKHVQPQENHRAPNRPAPQPWPSETPPEQELRPPHTPRSKHRLDRRKPERKWDRGQWLVGNRKGRAANSAHRACSSSTGRERIVCKLRNLPCNAF